MKDNRNIEELFKEAFENFESDVNPDLWTGIQNNIHSPSASNGISGGNSALQTGISVGKITAGIIASGALIGTVWYFATADNKTFPPSSQQSSGQQDAGGQNQELILAENNSAAGDKTVSSENSPYFLEKKKNVSGKNERGSSENNISAVEGDASDVSSSDGSGSGSSNPQHKFGKAPNRQAGLMRGNTVSKNSLKTSSENVYAETSLPEPAPSASIVASTHSGDCPLEVAFSNQGPASSVKWDFGDGNASSDAFVKHVFSKPGKYNVTLSVKNNSAEEAFDKITIEVFPISAIENIPNTFSPNGDADNDVFTFKLKNIASISVVIYNQRQETVHSWNTIDGKWDGKLKTGSDAPAGVYFYIIQATGTDGEKYYMKNSVTLFR